MSVETQSPIAARPPAEFQDTARTHMRAGIWGLVSQRSDHKTRQDEAEGFYKYDLPSAGSLMV